jgi:hypothetical protein
MSGSRVVETRRRITHCKLWGNCMQLVQPHRAHRVHHHRAGFALGDENREPRSLDVAVQVDPFESKL